MSVNTSNTNFVTVTKSDRAQFKLTSAYIAAFVKSPYYSLCQKGVNPSYIIQTALPSASFILTVEKPSVQTRSNLSSKNLGGFAIVRIGKDDLYIDVVCGKGHGTTMIKFLMEAAKMLGKKYILLSSLEKPVPFYKKLGFVFGEKLCSEDANIKSAFNKHGKMSNNLANLLVKKKRVKGCKTAAECKAVGYPMTKCLNQSARNRSNSQSSNSKQSTQRTWYR
jgi:hypothetical protein